MPRAKTDKPAPKPVKFGGTGSDFLKMNQLKQISHTKKVIAAMTRAQLAPDVAGGRAIWILYFG